MIRPCLDTDADLYCAKLQADSAHLSAYFSNMISMNTTAEQMRAYFAEKAADWQQGRGYSCGIFLQDSGELIGHVSVREIDLRVPKGELAYFIFSDYTGHRYAAEALLGFRDWCFAEKGMNRLFMKIGLENTGSMKVAESCGFLEEGLLKKDYRTGSRLVDMKIFGYTAG